MPKYACEPDHYEGSVFPPIYPLDVLDANGKVLGPRIVYFETETGIVIEHPENADGQSTLTRSGGQYLLKVTLNPAPLTMVPYPLVVKS